MFSSNRFALALLLFLHLLLGLAYAFATPYRTPGIIATSRARVLDVGAPDERQHVNYIQRLVSGQGFPVLDTKDPNLYENYQAHQPPLYYVLASGWAKLTGQNDLSTRTAGLVLRALNVLIGCATVAGVFFLCSWGFGRRDIALAASAFAALLPMNVALSGAVSNDPLLFCLCTWTLAMTALGMTQGWTTKRAVGLGVLLGLAFLTKTTALALAPAVLVGAFAPGVKRPEWKHAASVLVLAFILAMPWWMRNQSLYGDPFAIKAFNAAFVGSPGRLNLPGPPDLPTYFVSWVGWWTARSFVGVFGYMDIFLAEKFYRIALALLLILALGGFLSFNRPEWKGAKPIHILNATFLVVVTALFIRFNMQYFQGQARYLFPAIGPLSALFGLGMLYFSREKWKSTFIVWVVILTATNLYIVSQFLPFQFAKRTGITYSSS
jgi:4-amino-4-deoxy-L-arabinose transferase-like glycosyltransferase